MNGRCGRSGSTARIAPTNGTASSRPSYATSTRPRWTPRSRAPRASIRTAWTSVISCLRQLRLPCDRYRRQNYLARIALTERALALDPNYVWALREDARMHADLVLNGFSSDRDADLAYAMKTVDRALQFAPNDHVTLREKANVLRAQGDLDGAAALLRKVIELQATAGLEISRTRPDPADPGAPQGSAGELHDREATLVGGDPAYRCEPRRGIAGE